MEIRQEILAKGKNWVGFDDLLDICWSRNIPVIYMPELPMTGKMDGMVLRHNNKFAIILSKKAQNNHPSRLLFVLAHEMGHIAHGHLSGEQLQIIEEQIKYDESEDNLALDDNLHQENEEIEANKYAKDLLNGKTKEHVFNNFSSPEIFSKTIQTKGFEKNIEPGFLTLNAAYNYDKSGKGNAWGLAENILKNLKLYDNGCLELCQKFFAENIAYDEIKVETWELLKNLKVIAMSNNHDFAHRHL